MTVVIGSIVRRALNPSAILRHRKESAQRHAHADCELDLYAKMFRNDFLHAGYFARIPESGESISLKDIREAMRAYCELALARVSAGQSVLDVGCGMGGLLKLLADAGTKPTGLTPNPAHAEHIRRTYPDIPLVVSGFERLDTTPYRHAFDIVVSLEAFHNVPMDAGLRKVAEVLKPGGRWILIDYYRTRIPAYNRSGYPLEAFRSALASNGFRVIEEIDITDHALPALAFAHVLATRFAIPGLEFAMENFFRRHWLLEYLLADVTARMRSRIRLDAVDPDVFARDKRYLLQQIVLR
jgi:cyclopropane fatty-acyl-phospholipid synthase-like methyltransferase